MPSRRCSACRRPAGSAPARRAAGSRHARGDPSPAVAGQCRSSTIPARRRRRTRKIVKARYSRPCLMHGSIGPSCAVALWENDGVTVWTHSQGVYPLRKALAELLRLPARARCAASMSRARAATATMAPTMSPPTQPSPPAPCPAVRCACNGCASRSMAGSRSARRWWSSWRPTLGATAASPAGATTSGATRTTPARHRRRPAGRRARSIRPSRRQIPKPIPMPEGGGARNGNPIYALPNAQGDLSTSSSRRRCASRRCAGWARR